MGEKSREKKGWGHERPWGEWSVVGRGGCRGERGGSWFETYIRGATETFRTRGQDKVLDAGSLFSSNLYVATPEEVVMERRNMNAFLFILKDKRLMKYFAGRVAASLLSPSLLVEMKAVEASLFTLT
jgi:hypothetical protein